MHSTFTFLCLALSFIGANGIDYMLNINLAQSIGTTEKEYLSICLDPYLKHDYAVPWATLDFKSPKLHTLLRGLAPATLRFGGTDADWSIFYNVTNEQEQKLIWKLTRQLVEPNSTAFIVPFFPQDIDHLISLAQSASGKLLFDLNIQKRLGARWDATNALHLMHYLLETQQSQKVFFELGNEPNYPELSISGQRIAEDFQILRRALDTIPGFGKTKLVGADFNKLDTLDSHSDSNVNKSSGKTRLVGPDIGMADAEFLVHIVRDFAKYAAKTVDALTLHHYYFRGPGSKVEQFYDLQYFKSYPSILRQWRDVIWGAAGFELPIWVGETSDSYSYGSPNITDRYASGFLWLDKLGVSAQIGIKLVARQDLYGGNYPLLSPELNPNPDYWLSHVFKQLVGHTVYNTSLVSSDSIGYVRAYVHGDCQSGFLRKLTVFALNLSPNTTTTMQFDEQYNSTMEVYLMTPGDGGLLSKTVKLNGVTLMLVDDHTLPTLTPVYAKTSAGLQMPPLTYGFVVFQMIGRRPCA